MVRWKFFSVFLLACTGSFALNAASSERAPGYAREGNKAISLRQSVVEEEEILIRRHWRGFYGHPTAPGRKPGGFMGKQKPLKRELPLI
jgi:hypothetical protein